MVSLTPCIVCVTGTMHSLTVSGSGDGDLTFAEFFDWSQDPSKQTSEGTKFLRMVNLAPEPATMCGQIVSDNALWLFSPQSSLRKFCQSVATNSIFEFAILICILVSCVILAMDSPNADDETKNIVEGSSHSPLTLTPLSLAHLLSVLLTLPQSTSVLLTLPQSRYCPVPSQRPSALAHRFRYGVHGDLLNRNAD